MAEVLVLVDHVDGTVRKTTLEMLTIARRLGEPSAVLIGAGFDPAKAVLAQYGAEKIYRVESVEVTDYLGAPPKLRCSPSSSLPRYRRQS